SSASTAPPAAAAMVQTRPSTAHSTAALMAGGPAARANRPASSVGLSEETELLDLLVEVRARHLDRARRLAHVPVVLAQLGEDVRPLGALLELGEARRVEQVRGQRARGLRARDQAF